VFEGAREELERARLALDGLRRAHDQREFLTRFNDVVGSAQLVVIALLREGRGKRLPGFARWYEAKIQAFEQDELMSIVRDARDYDFNDGPHKLRFVSGQSRLRTDETGRPVSEGAWWTMPAAPSTHVAIDNAPVTHDGVPMDRSDPVAFCMGVVTCLDRLLDEAGEAVA
jgi:hypothetical protein